MAKSKKLSRKEINQPDQFVTRGEQILQNLVDNRKRYAIYVGSVLAFIILANLVCAYFQNQNDKISMAYSDALRVYNADVVTGDDVEANPTGKNPTFPTEEAKYLAANEKLQSLVDEHGSSSYGTVAKFYLGNTLFHLKRYTKAREAYQSFLDEAGSDFDSFKFMAYHDIAQCYDGENNLEKALETYKKILTLDGNAGKDDANYRIAMIYKRQGKKDEAVKLLLETQEKYPESSLKPKMDKLLTYLRGPAPKEEAKEEKSEEKAEAGK